MASQMDVMERFENIPTSNTIYLFVKSELFSRLLFQSSDNTVIIEKIQISKLNNAGLGMDLLKERIRKDGRIKDNHIIKVDGFLNHQIDIGLLDEIGKEFRRLFDGENITKIVTIEASGIAVACLTAKYFNVPIVFAKKSESKNIDGDVYRTTVTSYTRGRDYTVILEKRYLTSDDRILIIDDILATGKAQRGLLDISTQAGAAVAGIGVVIEKGFQGAGTSSARPDTTYKAWLLSTAWKTRRFASATKLFNNCGDNIRLPFRYSKKPPLHYSVWQRRLSNFSQSHIIVR